MKLIRLVIISLLLSLVALSAWARPLVIEITEGIDSALPVAIVPFGWDSAAVIPVDVAEIVSSDLQRTGLFEPLDSGDFLSKPTGIDAVKFRDWRLLNASNLVIGNITQDSDVYVIEFYVFDIFKGKKLIGYALRANRGDLRNAAHQVSDIVYEALTGQPGAFATQIAYISVTEKAGKKRYSLQVSDADGFNPQSLLNSPEPILSPSWSPDGRQVAYVSYEERRPRIYVQEISSGKREAIASFSGLNSAPVWSPDGKSMALVLSKDGSPDIYVMDVASRDLRRLTTSAAIETEPSWSPDGKTIAFTSDRGGSPQIYRVSASGGRSKRLSFEGKYNARPRFSPNGEYLAMVHVGNNSNGAYRIAVLDMDVGTLRVLTEGQLDESPSFAPNGSMIIYATEQQGRGVLAAVSTDGRVHQRLSIQDGDTREPVWSPFKK
ncbi:MAG: Tol-Pal system beta propeller repeat protein TolB [Gammaproteobacteria bacterium]|nr:MAG: Tol-Pal system beta propeller repeat protein TolB [Gammaproteobacteria bacterium]